MYISEEDSTIKNVFINNSTVDFSEHRFQTLFDNEF